MSSSGSRSEEQKQEKEGSILLVLTSPEINNAHVFQQLQHNAHAALAFVLHLLMIQRGFRLVGLSESDPIRELPPDANAYIPPENWNKNPDVYCFKYKHSQSSMTFILKCVPLGDRLLVHALAIEDKKPYSLEMDVNEYIDIDQLRKSESNLVDLYKRLDNIETFFRLNIMNRLVPFLNKEGYESERVASTTVPPTTTPSNIQPQPPRPIRPDNEYNDPLRIGPPRMPRPLPAEYNPYEIGRSDLYPDVGAPYFRGGPASGFPGGMVGPNHPIFGGGLGIPRPGMGPRQPGIPPGVPSGARFDPYGPPGTGRGVPGPNPDNIRSPHFDDEDENPYFF